MTPDPITLTDPFLEFRDHCLPEFLESLAASPDIGAFSRYSPLAAERQLAALAAVSRFPGSRVLVAHRGRELLAYLTFHPPEPEGRWADCPAGEVLELGGVEVARGMRHRGLATLLIHRAFSAPEFDTKVVYAQGLTWCWDLRGTGLSVMAYRDMVFRLFAAYGFELYPTDEPNICHDRNNLLLVRIGAKASMRLVEQFRAVLIDGRGDPALGPPEHQSERKGGCP